MNTYYYTKLLQIKIHTFFIPYHFQVAVANCASRICIDNDAETHRKFMHIRIKP